MQNHKNIKFNLLNFLVLTLSILFLRLKLGRDLLSYFQDFSTLQILLTLLDSLCLPCLAIVQVA